MKFIVSGYGQMGKLLVERIESDERHQLVEVVDPFGTKGVKSFEDIEEVPDMILDFSHPNNLPGLLAFAIKNSVPTLLATTNYSDKDIEMIKEASKEIPILHTSNTSYGIQVLIKAASLLSQLLPDADIEVIETHHKHKVDAPSGTAKMLLEVLTKEDTDLVYGRVGESKRTKNEIGVHSIRGGSVSGIHEVQFLMNGENITIKHQAESKQVFVEGALKASTYLVKQKPGYYSMKDTIEV